jgi:hypothetical protein
MKAVADMSMEELAAYVCDALAQEGIETVLSGGCCVEIYSEGRYTSDDIDLIDRFNGGHRKIREVMERLGFREHSVKRYFIHDQTPYFIEFPRGPLGVGDAPVKEIAEKEYCTGTLKLLTATDCVKDRLAAFFYWDDTQSLVQAVWVARSNEVDIDAVRDWAIREGMEEKFDIFIRRLST